ncbi:MAG: S8 family serine peptidase [bacterium]
MPNLTKENLLEIPQEFDATFASTLKFWTLGYADADNYISHDIKTTEILTQPHIQNGSGGKSKLPFTPSNSTNTPSFTPSDPLYASQWHFGFLGDIESIWNDFTGTGVKVGVYDDGLQYTHEDLDDNYDSSLQVSVSGSIIDPIPSSSDPHGTSVSGLIAAEQGNGLGGVGVAFDASLTGINIFSGPADVNNQVAGFLEAIDQVENFDVVNHSWGSTPSFDPSGLAFDQALIAEYSEGLANGRGGLGTIQLQAAGNDDLNANGDYTNVARETITVGAHDDDGDVSWYSNHGASVLISAPSNGDGSNAGQTTTDLTGANGYSSNNYTSSFGGTSGATPVTTGVVALMLDANSGLGWRDVQDILAYSAHELGSGIGGTPAGDELHSWYYNSADNWNGGGLHFSEDYGYGGVDAFNAVRMAEVWSLFTTAQTSANEDSFSAGVAGLNATLPDQSDQTFTINVAQDIELDYLAVELDITHTWLPDLTIELISPEGTTVRLFNTGDGSSSLAPSGWQWTFGVESLRGEMTAGDWQLHIVDNAAQDSGEWDGITFTAYGHDNASAGVNLDNDVYHYTDEFSNAFADQASRVNLSDTAGTDWVNLAAVTSDLVLDLASSATSTAGGVDIFTTDASTVIENAIGGDGNDNVTGNSVANELYGMRGADMLYGLDGDDTLFGGDGNDILEGGLGADTIDGGAGTNTGSYSGAASRVIVDLQNSAINFGEAVGDSYTNVTDLIGSRYNDQLRGNASDNNFQGGNFSDRLYGRAGNDTLNGQNGTDAIYGNSGQDTMTGEAGNDRYIYFQLSDSNVGAATRDIITDFKVTGNDRIEISRFDADTGVAGNQAFALIGAAAFSNTAGELRYEQDAGNNWTLVQGDNNGDSIADFEIQLNGLLTLVDTDFLL